MNVYCLVVPINNALKFSMSANANFWAHCQWRGIIYCAICFRLMPLQLPIFVLFLILCKNIVGDYTVRHEKQILFNSGLQVHIIIYIYIEGKNTYIYISTVKQFITKAFRLRFCCYSMTMPFKCGRYSTPLHWFPHQDIEEHLISATIM